MEPESSARAARQPTQSIAEINEDDMHDGQTQPCIRPGMTRWQ